MFTKLTANAPFLKALVLATVLGGSGGAMAQTTAPTGDEVALETQSKGTDRAAEARAQRVKRGDRSPDPRELQGTGRRDSQPNGR